MASGNQAFLISGDDRPTLVNGEHAVGGRNPHDAAFVEQHALHGSGAGGVGRDVQRNGGLGSGQGCPAGACRQICGRVQWAARVRAQGIGLPLFLMRRADDQLLGAITLDNIRRGPSQSASIGYWIGQPYARQGYMREAVQALVHHAFSDLDLSRIEAACLPENAASRAVLEKSGFKYEGIAQSYLQINGRWRNHVLYANLRGDRRGRTDVG